MLGRLDIEVPEHLLASEVQGRREQISSQLDSAGLTLEQYLEDSEEASDEDAFWADIEKRSGDALKAQMILDKVAEDRQISVDQNDLTQHIIRKAQESNTNPQEVANHLQEHPHHIDEYMLEIRRGKSLALLVEAAQVTDSTGAPVDLVNLQPDGTVGAADSEVLEGTVEGDDEPGGAADDEAPTATDDSVQAGEAEEAAEAKA
jgi:trigger factor